MSHCQVLPTLCPLQVETAVVGSQQGLPFESTGTVTTEEEPVVDGFPAHSIQVLHPRPRVPNTYEAIQSDHPEQSTVLARCGLPSSPHGRVCHQSSSGSMPQGHAVVGSMSQTHTTSNSTLPDALMGKCKHFTLIPIVFGWGIIRTISENWGKNAIGDSNLLQRKGRFGEMTT